MHLPLRRACACSFPPSLPRPLPPASRARCPSSQNFRGQGLSSASVALHHRPMDSCHSFAPRDDLHHRCSGTPLAGKSSRACTKPIHLVNINTVQHGVYGGFAWCQITGSNGQSPWNNAHPCPLHRQLRGCSSNAIWHRQRQPPTGELLAQSSGGSSESRPPSLDCQPFLVTLSGFASFGGHLRSQDC